MINMIHGDCMEYMAGLEDAGSYYDEKGKQDHKTVLDLYSSGVSRREISESTGIAYTTISRMLQPGYQPFKTDARYFSETQRGAEWFSKI